MQLINFPNFKNYTNQKVNFIQPKMDGHLTKIYIDKSSLYAFTKNDKDITEKLLMINHIRKKLDGLPNNSVVFAELHCPGVPATSVPTMLNNADERLQLTVFAAPSFDGFDWTNAHLPHVMTRLERYCLKVPETVVVESCHKQISSHWQKELLEEAKEKKLEGWVLKEEHMKGWYKLKPVKTIDAVIVGTYKSFSSTHYGGLQAIHIMVYEKNGKTHDLGHVGSGFSLLYRKSLDTQAKRDTLIRKVCVVAYDSLAANGKLRFPRMAKDENDCIIWRTDKDPKQCTMEQFE